MKEQKEAKVNFENAERKPEMIVHSDPCCCKWGCKCRCDANGQCKACLEKTKRQEVSEWWEAFGISVIRKDDDCAF